MFRRGTFQGSEETLALLPGIGRKGLALVSLKGDPNDANEETNPPIGDDIPD